MFKSGCNNTIKAFQSGRGIAGHGRWLGQANPYRFPTRADWKIASNDKKVEAASGF
jgi:hypothetical protein